MEMFLWLESRHVILLVMTLRYAFFLGWLHHTGGWHTWYVIYHQPSVDWSDFTGVVQYIIWNQNIFLSFVSLKSVNHVASSKNYNPLRLFQDVCLKLWRIFLVFSQQSESQESFVKLSLSVYQILYNKVFYLRRLISIYEIKVGSSNQHQLH